MMDRHDIPELPEIVVMRDGQVVRIEGNKWRMRHSAELSQTEVVNWTLLTELRVSGTGRTLMSASAVRYAQLYITYKLRTVTARSAKVFMIAILEFARWLAKNSQWLAEDREFEWGDLTEDMFDAWFSVEVASAMRGVRPGHVRNFYRWGADPDAPHKGFSPALSQTLENYKFKRPAKGEVVASRDARHGPLTSDELDLIRAPCLDGKGTDRDRAITFTLLDSIVRPEQLALLRNCDLLADYNLVADVAGPGSDSSLPRQPTYALNVRVIKGRTTREEYRIIPISPECGRLLMDLRQTGSAPEAPLFPWIVNCFVSNTNRALERFFEAADLRSPRLPIKDACDGEPQFERMPISPRRFRYGVATDRLAAGDTPENIADTLTHRGLYEVVTYADTSPLIADEFRRATDYKLTPIVRIMLGLPPEQECFENDDDEPSLRSVVAKAFPKLESSVMQGIRARGFVDGVGSDRLTDESTEQMSDLLTLSGSEERVAVLVASARCKFLRLYPGQQFDAPVWHVDHIKERVNGTGSTKLEFTTLDRLREDYSESSPNPTALPSHFVNVVKSWLVQRSDVTCGYNACRLCAARHFWRFLCTEQPGRARTFKWRTLTEYDLLAFENYLTRCLGAKGKALAPASILSVMKGTMSLVNFLSSRGICRRVDYTMHTRSPRIASLRKIALRLTAAEEKLPRPEILEAIAKCYYRITSAAAGEFADWVLLLTYAVAVLMLTGLRIGELVTLPEDCEIEEDVGRDEHVDGDGGETRRYGLRYWVEKRRDKTLRIKWISPTAEPVVREAIRQIKRLTAGAKERAKVLEADPTQVALPPHFADRLGLTEAEVVELLGVKISDSLRRQGLRTTVGRGRARAVYDRRKVEALLLSRRVKHLCTMRFNDGSFQTLSQSLFVVFHNQSRFQTTGHCALLVEPVTYNHVEKFLRCAPNTKRTTLFLLGGSTAEERKMSIRPHGFRHWLHHIAYKGGMPIHLITRYFGRKDDCDTQDYLHSIAA
jgi:integrase